MPDGETRKLSEEEAEEAELARLRRRDADIEADISGWSRRPRRPVGKAKRGQRRVGCPLAFLGDVCRLTEGRAPVLVAELIYRRTYVCKSRTVTLPSAELAELGITRQQKARALTKLATVNLIRIEKSAGCSARVTLLWRAP